MSRSLNIWWAAWAFLAAMCVTQSWNQPRARAEQKRVAVLEFTGQSASAFHAQITQGLKGHVDLVSPREVKSTASRLGNSLSSPSDYKELGEALNLSAIIEGSVVKKARNLNATVKVRDMSTGEVVHEETWNKRRSQMKSIKPTVWPALRSAIDQTSAPTKAAKPSKGKAKAKPEPVAVPEEVEEPEEEEEAPPRKRRRPAARVEEEEEEEASAEEAEEEEEEEAPKKKKKKANVATGKSVEHPVLIASIGPRIMWRSLSYDGDTNLNSYTSTDQGSPSVNLAVSAQYFPAAYKYTEWYSDFGVDFDLDYAMGLKSKQDGKKLSTTAYEIAFGAVYRHQFGAFIPKVRVDYVHQTFDVSVPSTTLLPSVNYNAVRFNLGAGVDIVEWLQLDASFGYLPVFSTGDLDSARYGGKVSTKAWEAGAGALVRIREVYGIRAGIDYRRYNYDFGLASNLNGIALPKSGQDSYLRTTLSFVYTLPGVK